MAVSRAKVMGLVIASVGVFLGIAVALIVVLSNLQSRAFAREPLTVRLDNAGPYLILSTKSAANEYADGVALATKLHPKAVVKLFSPENLSAAKILLHEHQPHYVMIFIRPDELDVNFAWQWLKLTTEVDADPFVDVRTGFITGESPQAVNAFVQRIINVVEGRKKLSATFVDNLGHNSMAAKTAFFKDFGNFYIPILGERVSLYTISHGSQGFSKERLGSMDLSGVVHFGGHGYPDGIVDGLRAVDVRDLKLAPCVVFNGACYTGVTWRWFDFRSGKIKEKQIQSEDSFCLGMLTNNVVGYFAALHPDHGIPVYQEMEYMATSGASLGDIIKHTHDGVIIGAGGKLPDFETMSDSMARPRWTPADFMLRGTAARVLFGDPALVITDSFTDLPFEVTVKKKNETILGITALLKNTMLKSTYTDTYYSDMSKTKQFNDRALIVCDLPQGFETVRNVKVIKVEAAGNRLSHRLIGYGVEKERDKHRLHVQVDLPSSGYMESTFRQRGAVVNILVEQ